MSAEPAPQQSPPVPALEEVEQALKDLAMVNKSLQLTDVSCFLSYDIRSTFSRRIFLVFVAPSLLFFPLPPPPYYHATRTGRVAMYVFVSRVDDS